MKNLVLIFAMSFGFMGFAFAGDGALADLNVSSNGASSVVCHDPQYAIRDNPNTIVLSKHGQSPMMLDVFFSAPQLTALAFDSSTELVRDRADVYFAHNFHKKIPGATNYGNVLLEFNLLKQTVKVTVLAGYQDPGIYNLVCRGFHQSAYRMTFSEVTVEQALSRIKN